MSDTLRVVEAAKVLGICRRLAYDRIDEGRLEVVNHTRPMRVSLESVHREQTDPPPRRKSGPRPRLTQV